MFRYEAGIVSTFADECHVINCPPVTNLKIRVEREGGKIKLGPGRAT